MAFGIGMNFGDDRIGEQVIVDRPSTGTPEDLPLGDDLDVVIAAVTAVTSRLLVTVRRCKGSAEPDIELDSVTGLLRVVGVDAPTAADGSVTWGATQVTVHVAAAVTAQLKVAEYLLTLEELTAGGRRLPKHSRQFFADHSAGGLRV